MTTVVVDGGVTAGGVGGGTVGLGDGILGSCGETTVDTGLTDGLTGS